MPRDPPVTKTFTAGAGAAASTGAEEGSSSQPMRSGDSRWPSSAFDEAWPRSSRRCICGSAYAAHLVVGGQVGDELAHARADLVGEVRRRRPDEGVDVVAGRLAIHRARA